MRSRGSRSTTPSGRTSTRAVRASRCCSSSRSYRRARSTPPTRFPSETAPGSSSCSAFRAPARRRPVGRQGQDPPSDTTRAAARQALAASTLSVGLVPVVAAPERTLGTIGAVVEAPGEQISFQLPLAPPGGVLPPPPAPRAAHYRTLDARFLDDV